MSMADINCVVDTLRVLELWNKRSISDLELCTSRIHVFAGYPHSSARLTTIVDSYCWPHFLPDITFSSTMTTTLKHSFQPRNHSNSKDAVEGPELYRMQQGCP